MKLKDFLNQQTSPSRLQIVGPRAHRAPRLDPRSPVVFVDGGTRWREGLEGFSVGDGDSWEGPLDERLHPEKDVSDLGYVLRHIENRFSELFLFGFLGGRKDQEIFNLGEIHHLLSRRQQPLRVQFDQEILAMSPGRWKEPLEGFFSLLVMQPTELRLTGDLKFPVEKTITWPAFSSFGMSNRANGFVQIESQGPFFVLLGAED